MNFIKHLVITTLVISTSTMANIQLKAKDGFNIVGTYFSTDPSSQAAVLMLHQCNYNQTMYKNIGKQLSNNGVHALSIDFRGFGKSKNQTFDVSKFANLGTEKRREAWRAMSAHWPSDVQIAYNYLKDKVGKTGKIAVIGASCGGGQAIELSKNNSLAAIGFFSSAQSDERINQYVETLSDKPTLIIAADEDGRTYTSAQRLFVEANHRNSQFLAYKGEEHGYPLLDKDVNLKNTIVNWLSAQVK
ncbi:hypothetical protein N474_22110 [Pseudoalteromonas luteoviolacea CPMOR-2]|uniref:Serine aminopeptidase S33 domain-containing protein n=1 Tax=Pseudoalteromonas luteoviolacea DSM 6061 TaxID=1365250 RepID=A0A166V1M6_9GAMM|nr:alpha/beta hydrolase [Pseudoalteromonas luteoviolacea]KZN31624.1 hypothetical protein N475_23010 [Pseudoalteromonas luteoviolacea DSM 6061]KZN53093.1 hypothetical protein N474_22110 [Pseudoalteromonas luteoviolacea CPMOR-2]MBE0389784.1 hypothetical protein [Pseudoalteromonas luteoviolacea DSM 6061]